MAAIVANSDAIAVIGLAARVPGADDVEEFWDNLVRGRESITQLDESFLRAHGVRPDQLADPDYVGAAALVDGVEDFDADFFGLTPRDAAATDPQIRLFLEISHSVLEDAGYDPSDPGQAVGIFASVGPSRYATMHLGENPEMAGGAGLAMHTLNHSDYLATTVSYRLNLHGPSLTVLTACSSSLVAVHLACQSLRAGDCDAAIVGGASIEFPFGHGYRWSPGSVLSRDGHCRPFDADANGTVFGSGVAAVLLKPLAEAIEDGDRVRAVILASAVNNDGADKVSFGAPSLAGQAAVVMEAMQLAEVRPADIGYVEMHGTGTPLGDPIEVAALADAYAALADGETLPDDIGIGSVKGNVGHLGPVAGVTGLIKAVLALEREQLPPTINLSTPNPRLELDRTPFSPVRSLRAWPAGPDSRRRAAVSSLGIGGTNVHVVLGEAPFPDQPFTPPGQQLLVWSARTVDAADAVGARLADWFTRTGDVQLAAAAATLQHGRERHAIRRAAVVTDARDAAAALTDPHRIWTQPRPVAVPGPAELPTAAFRSFAARVPGFEPLLVEVVGATGAHDAALEHWATGSDDAVLAVALRVALARLWLRHGAPLDLLEAPVDCPELLKALDPAIDLAELLPNAPIGPADRPGGRPADALWARHLELLATLWLGGTNPDWSALGCPPPGRRAALPSYPYQRVRHWVPAKAATRPVEAAVAVDAAELGLWTPTWAQADQSRRTGPEAWGPVAVVQPAEHAAARSVELALRQLGVDPVSVEPGLTAAIDPDAIVIDARLFGPGADATSPVRAAGRLLILTSAAVDVSGCESVQPVRAAVVAAALAADPAGVWLDAPAHTAPQQLAAGLVGALGSKLDALAVRGTRTWQPAQSSVETGQSASYLSNLRGGLVLIADEQGSVALDIAEAFASAGTSTDLLVLTGADPATRKALIAVEDAGPAIDLLPWPKDAGDLAAAVADAIGNRRVSGLVLAAGEAEQVAEQLSAIRALGTGLPRRLVAVSRQAAPPTAGRAHATAAALDLAGLGCESTVAVLTSGGPVGDAVARALAGECPAVVVAAR